MDVDLPVILDFFLDVNNEAMNNAHKIKKKAS
jgi:hypothetical protein